MGMQVVHRRAGALAISAHTGPRARETTLRRTSPAAYVLENGRSRRSGRIMVVGNAQHVHKRATNRPAELPR